MGNKANSILITGGAGFIGSNLAAHFLNKNWRVVVLDNLSTGKLKNIENFKSNKNFEFIEGDIRNFELLETTLKKFDLRYISHQAARGSVPKSIKNPLLSNDINVTGTLNVLWAAHQNNIEKVVCAISSSVYGDTEYLPKKESMGNNPMSPYAVTKSANEMYAKVFNDTYGLKTVGLRYFNVYGKNQDPNGAYAAVIPSFIRAALNNAPLRIFGNGRQTRDFTYIEDVIKANDLAIHEDSANGKSFNVAYGNNISILDLAKLIIKLSSSKSKIEFTEKRKGDVQDSLADLSFAKKHLKYNAKWPLEAGLQKTIEFYQNLIA